MERWKQFELECTDYLNNKYGNYFEHFGFSDSTTSDIRYVKDDKYFFIEAKMPSAQSGQFVLFPDKDNREFVFSTKNKSIMDENAEFIIEFMNNDFDKYENAGTSGEDINIPQELLSDWIVNSYKRYGVEYFITKGKSGFIIFPIEKYSKYFDISCVYRVKKSGSSSVPKKRKPEVMEKIKTLGFKFTEEENFMIKTEENLDKLKFSVNDFDYMFRLVEDNTYRIRKLSNTYNANVIFSVELKREQDYSDLNDFEAYL